MEEQKMEPIIKSNDPRVRGGNLNTAQRDFMYDRNLTPEFSTEGKSWNFHKVLNTDTGVVPWLISIEGEYYAALSVPAGSRTSYRCGFYPASEKGKYSIGTNKRVAELNMYVDLEAACDEFAELMYMRKLEEAEIDAEMELIKENYEAEDKQS